MVASLLALLAVSAAVPTARNTLPSEVSESLQQALVVPGGRMVLLSWSQAGACRVRQASVPRSIGGSGRVAVKITGSNCTAWGWAEVEVWAQTAVVSQAIRAGEPIGASLRIVEQEIRPGRVPFLPPDSAITARYLPSDTLLSTTDVSIQPSIARDPIKIVFLSGSVAIEANGRRTTCMRGRACAVLASGKHVEGYFGESGRLIVEVPQ